MLKLINYNGNPYYPQIFLGGFGAYDLQIQTCISLTPKGTFLHQIASFEPSTTKTGLAIQTQVQWEEVKTKDKLEIHGTYISPYCRGEHVHPISIKMVYITHIYHIIKRSNLSVDWAIGVRATRS